MEKRAEFLKDSLGVLGEAFCLPSRSMDKKASELRLSLRESLKEDEEHFESSDTESSESSGSSVGSEGLGSQYGEENSKPPNLDSSKPRRSFTKSFLKPIRRNIHNVSRKRYVDRSTSPPLSPSIVRKGKESTSSSKEKFKGGATIQRKPTLRNTNSATNSPTSWQECQFSSGQRASVQPQVAQFGMFQFVEVVWRQFLSY